MYTDQRATVLTDVEGDEFSWNKTRRPLCGLFFNSVLQSAMERDMKTWTEKGLAIKLSDEKIETMSNQHIADDVLTMANSLKQLKK